MKTVDEILFSLSYVTIGQILRGSEYETQQVNISDHSKQDNQGKDTQAISLVQ